MRNTVNTFGTKWNSNQSESNNRKNFFELYKQNPIPADEMLMNLPLFMKRQDLSQLLFVHEMYQHILDVHGVVMEFGVRWGKNLALMQNLRGIYEPFNHNRKIIGFDTFSGFPSVDLKDGHDPIIKKGAYSVTAGYESFLQSVMEYQESESPISHIKKFELVKGDASVSIKKYLSENPHTVVAMAYFDFDIYQPTYDCLMAIKDRLTKGAVIGFDELNCNTYPGETLALKEVFGIGKYKVRHSKFSPTQSYLILD